MADYEIFARGDFPFENGRVLPDAKLAYKTYGQLNERKSNAVLLCSYFTGNHASYEFLIQPGCCFDPNTYFVISTNLFSNGFSSSPSNQQFSFWPSGGHTVETAGRERCCPPPGSAAILAASGAGETPALPGKGRKKGRNGVHFCKMRIAGL